MNLMEPLIIYDRERLQGEIACAEGDCACPLSFSPQKPDAQFDTLDGEQTLRHAPAVHTYEFFLKTKKLFGGAEGLYTPLAPLKGGIKHDSRADFSLEGVSKHDSRADFSLEGVSKHGYRVASPLEGGRGGVTNVVSSHYAEQNTKSQPCRYSSDSPHNYHFLASAHTRAGIAVLNDTGFRLWQQFRKPCTAKSALQDLGIAGKTGAEWQAIRELFACGFIRAVGDAATPLAEEDTLIAWLHTTNACNLRCSYCYLNKSAQKMSQATGMKAIDAIFRSARLNGFRKVKIKYAGGEPTLNFPLICHLHDQAKQLASNEDVLLRGVILSNGVHLTEKMVGEMLARQMRLMISLDGVGAFHDNQRHFANGRGSFDSAIKNIEMAKALGLTPDICVTVTGQSAAALPVLIEWILERNLPFSLNFYRENNQSEGFDGLKLEEEQIISGMSAAFKSIEENLPQRSLLASLTDRANLSAPHTYSCAAGHNYMVIDQNGGIAKCQMEMTNAVTDISAENPLAIIRADKAGLQNPGVDDKEGCRDCEWKYWCTGGCPQATYRATGRYDIQSPNCNIYKKLYPQVARLEALRLLRYHQVIIS